MKISYFLVLLVIAFLLGPLSGWAQIQDSFPKRTIKKDSGQIIHLINADKLYGIQGTEKDSSEQIQKLIGNVRLRQGETIFTSDSAIQYMSSNTIDAFGHIHINQADSIHTYSDFLHYEGDTRIATLETNVKMTDGDMVLTSDYLDYDMEHNIGSYLGGGKLVNDETVLTSQIGTYYVDTKDAFFKEDVKLNDPQYTLTTDTLQYNIETKIATFVAPTAINTGGGTVIYTSCGYYSTEEQFAHLCNQPMIEDSTGVLLSDSLNFYKEEGIGYGYENTRWTDSSGEATIKANFVISNRDKKTILATQKPLMILAQDQDSLFIAADTLFSGPLYPPKDSLVSGEEDSLGYVYMGADHPIAQKYADSLIENGLLPDSATLAQQLQEEMDSVAIYLPVLIRYQADDSIVIPSPLIIPPSIRSPKKKKEEPKEVEESEAFKASKERLRREKLNLPPEDSVQQEVNPNALPAKDKQEIKKDESNAVETLYPQYDSTGRDTRLIQGLSKDSVPPGHDSIPSDLRRSFNTPVDSVGVSPGDSTLINGSDSLMEDTTQIDSTEFKKMLAYHHVRLFSDSLQAAADSLFYSDADSSFRFYQDPVLWTGETQLIGDTIVLTTKNQKAHKLILQNNAIIINQVGEQQFNQIKGNLITGFFNDSNQLVRMDVEGNAESIYYAQEDSTGKFIGLNRTTSANIKLYFKDNGIERVVFLKNPEGTFMNPARLKEEDLYLPGFKWEDKRRPKSKEDLYPAQEEHLKENKEERINDENEP